MQPPDASDDLVISTPERVAFQYEIAGIGSRFLAQIVDALVILVILIAITILAAALGGVFSSGELALLIEVILGFIVLAGYFLISEAAWNGQTLGKRSARLRVVGDQGGPRRAGQRPPRRWQRRPPRRPASRRRWIPGDGASSSLTRPGESSCPWRGE